MNTVVVVGGGPAGSLTATLLARAGHDVTVVDRARFPRPKPCGECLNPGAVAVLARHGLLASIERHDPAHLDGWVILGPLGGTYPTRFPNGHVALGVDRARLDHTLLLAARDAGARVVEGTKVVGVRPARGGSGPKVLLEGGRVLGARVVVGADGLRSVVARSLGATGRPGRKKASLSLHVENVALAPDCGRLLVGEPFTVGLAPLDRHGRCWTLTVVAPTSHAAAVPRDPTALLAFAAARERRLEPALVGARALGDALGSGPFVWPVAPVARQRVLLVGDAAGYFDPLTGQGLYGALRGAELAAAAATDIVRDPRRSEGIERSYRRQVASGLRSAHRLQRIVEFGRRRPWLLERTLRALDERGALDRLIAVLGDVHRPASLAHPSFLARLLFGPAFP